MIPSTTHLLEMFISKKVHDQTGTPIQAGQILIVLDGEGYHQLEGQPRQTMKKGEVIKVPANTRHWHGATENTALTQMYILPKTENGFVTWMEPVTDEQYKSIN
jgi:cupin superfamily acireductone dioxygenase involved in methionine salvage